MIWRSRVLASAMIVTLAFVGVAAADLIVRVRDKDGGVVATLSVPAGGSVEVFPTGAAPAPAPTPQPNPPPLPGPQPAPAQVKAAFLIVVRNDAAGLPAPATIAFLRSKAFKNLVAVKGLSYHDYDVSSDEVQKPPPKGFSYAGFLSDPKNGLTAPCALWIDKDGRLVRSKNLPADFAAIPALLD